MNGWVPAESAPWYVCGDMAIAVDPVRTHRYVVWNIATGDPILGAPIPYPVEDEYSEDDLLELAGTLAELDLPAEGLDSWLSLAQQPMHEDAARGAAIAAELREHLNVVDLASLDGSPQEMLVPGALVRGMHHLAYGEKEGGKTWWALGALVAPLLARGERVFWIDREMSGPYIKARLQALGVTDFSAFMYLAYPPLVRDRDTQERWRALLSVERPSLVIADAQAGVLAAADLNENQTGDVLKWDAWYFEEARSRGAATVMLDHVGHEEKGRARGAYGKGAAAKIELLVETVRAFDRQTVGSMRVTRRKNTLAAAIPEVVWYRVGGEPFVWEETEPESVTVQEILAQEDADQERLDAVSLKVLRALTESEDGLSGAKLEAAVGGTRDDVRLARERLVEDGRVSEQKREGRGGGKVYRRVTSPRRNRASSPATSPGGTTFLTPGEVGEVPKLGPGEVPARFGEVQDGTHWRD